MRPGVGSERRGSGPSAHLTAVTSRPKRRPAAG